MKPIIHFSAALIATFCIAIFYTSSVLVELFGSHEAIAMVKRLLVTPGLFILVPAIAITGGTGFLYQRVGKAGW